MLKIFGALVGIGAAISTVSLMVWPVLILACGYTLFTGVIGNWAWILALAGYAIILAVVARLAATSPPLQASIVIGGASIVTVGFLATHSMSWPTVFTAALATTFCFAISAMLSGHKVLLPYGAAAAIQLVWLAPLAVTAYNMSIGNYDALHIIATLAGIIAAIFATDSY